MKSLLPSFIFLLLVSCNAPIQSPSVESTSTIIIPTFTQTFIPTIDPTFTPVPPSQTPTPVPCDPLTSDSCITEFNFLFQRPIFPPDNDSIDMSYAYASTQRGRRDPHHGVEFQNPFGTPVYAAGDGVVVFADSDKITKFSPWTNFVILSESANTTSPSRSEEHTSELQSQSNLVCRLLLEKKKKK